MLWSLLEDNMNELPPETADAALQSVWAKAGEEGKKKRSALNAKHLQFYHQHPYR